MNYVINWNRALVLRGGMSRGNTQNFVTVPNEQRRDGFLKRKDLNVDKSRTLRLPGHIGNPVGLRLEIVWNIDDEKFKTSRRISLGFGQAVEMSQTFSRTVCDDLGALPDEPEQGR